MPGRLFTDYSGHSAQKPLPLILGSSMKPTPPELPAQ